MEITKDFLHWTVVAPCLLLLLLVAIHCICKDLIPRHVDYVRHVWYFYFLIAVLTVLVGMFCIHIDVIDAEGRAHGLAGDVLNKLLEFVFALKEDLMLGGGAVALILGPQVASYLFSGVLSGCAVRPKYTGAVFKFVTLSFAKSFTTAAGVMLGLGTLGWGVGWTGMAGKQAATEFLLSGFLLLLAFHILTSIAEVASIGEVPPTSRLGALWAKIDGWMTRNTR